MNVYLDNLRNHAVGLVGSSFSWLAVITGNQQQIEYWLRVTSLVGAIVVSALTAWKILKGRSDKSG